MVRSEEIFSVDEVLPRIVFGQSFGVLWVPYGQKGVDGGRKWRAGTRETEVRLEGWCEGGLGQQRNDGRFWASMSKRQERVESPGTYVTMSFTRPILLGSVFFRTALPSSCGLSRGEVWDAVTWCSWDKLKKVCNYWKSRADVKYMLRCLVKE